jgi:hypothetical protein
VVREVWHCLWSSREFRRRDLGSCQGSERVTHAGPDGTGTVCSVLAC